MGLSGGNGMTWKRDANIGSWWKAELKLSVAIKLVIDILIPSQYFSINRCVMMMSKHLLLLSINE